MRITRSYDIDSTSGAMLSATLHLTLTRSDALCLSIALDEALDGLTDHEANDEIADLAGALRDELDHVADMLKGA